jgi:hypothetical protein
LKKLTRKLAEQREAHANGTDLGWEYFRDIKVHRRVTESALSRSAHELRESTIANSPLESQVKVDEQDAKGISNPVGCSGVLSGHSSEARRGNDDSNEAGDVHASARVDAIVEPSTQRIVDQAYFRINL